MDSRTLPSSAGQQGLSILQLHHVGAKSGSKRVTPLAYWPASDTSVAALASNYGAERHPSRRPCRKALSTISSNGRSASALT